MKILSICRYNVGEAEQEDAIYLRSLWDLWGEDPAYHSLKFMNDTFSLRLAVFELLRYLSRKPMCHGAKENYEDEYFY